MEYIKGEWIAKACLIFSVEHPPRLVAETHVGNIGLKEAESNAHLIAQSPRMIEFIQQLANNGNKEAKDFMQTLDKS